MRVNILFLLAAIFAGILIWNIGVILTLPQQVANVGAYKIIYFHVPAAEVAFTGFFIALVSSGLYLMRGQLKYDAFAAGITEVSLAFATANLVSGMVWARYAWGIWWTWDARLDQHVGLLADVLRLYDAATVDHGADATRALQRCNVDPEASRT